MRDDILFWKCDWFNVIETQNVAARKDADPLPKSAFEERDMTEIAAEFCQNYSVIPPTLDPANITVEQREVDFDDSHGRMRYWTCHAFVPLRVLV